MNLKNTTLIPWTFLVPNYEKEGKAQFIVAVGCTGGMHRSVAMAEALYAHLLEKGYRVTVEHRDMMKNNVEEDFNPHQIKHDTRD